MGAFRKQQGIIRTVKFRLGSEVQMICCYIDGEDSLWTCLLGEAGFGQIKDHSVWHLLPRMKGLCSPKYNSVELKDEPVSVGKYLETWVNPA